MSSLVDISVEEEWPHVVIRVAGEVDTYSELEFRDRVLEAVERYADHDVALDLSGVTFMDSSGLGTLVTAHKRLRQAGRSLVILDPHPQPREVLEITGLAAVFQIAARPRQTPSGFDAAPNPA